MMVPFESVFNTELGMRKSVVEPMLFMENKVEVAPADVVEEMLKSIVLSDVEAAWRDKSADGEVEPSPKFPVVGLKRKDEVPVVPKTTVDDA